MSGVVAVAAVEEAAREGIEAPYSSGQHARRADNYTLCTDTTDVAHRPVEAIVITAEQRTDLASVEACCSRALTDRRTHFGGRELDTPVDVNCLRC